MVEEEILKQNGSVVSVRVIARPNVSKSEIVGIHNGALKVRVAAPAIEGRANEELVAFLAKVLGVAKRQVTVAKGGAARIKKIEVSGLSLADVREKLGL